MKSIRIKEIYIIWASFKFKLLYFKEHDKNEKRMNKMAETFSKHKSDKGLVCRLCKESLTTQQ
jgi:hypothetical protein